jgi:radical SAM superfamily enzyme YgiQ (UPF0313 family)
MKVRLVLTSAPVSLTERYGRFAQAASTEPSYGLVCLAAVAQATAKAEVAIVEAAAADLTVAAARNAILALHPDAVGLSATTAGIVAAGALARELKAARPNVLTLLGGCHVTALPEETLREFTAFDLGVVGEGEATLADILDHLADHRPQPWAILGTVARAPDGRIVRHPPRPLIPDLDTLPIPVWSLLRGFPRAFHPSPARVKRWPCASVVLTRGCPNDCVFCDRSVFGHRCRAYSPAYAVHLMSDLRCQHGVREVLIEDDTFVISKARVREFCERLIGERVDVTWSCLGRADCVDLDLLRLMRRAGCWHVGYGIESGDPGILGAMRKRLDLEEIRRAVGWSREAGLRTKGFFIVGFPGETPESLRRTQEFALSLPLDDITVTQMTPFPGSELYAIADRYGAFERDWRKMNALETVFVPRGLTRADLEQARVRMLRAFYLRPSVIARQLRHAAAHPRLLLRIAGGLPAFVRLIREHP